ncbi:DoxX family protein [Rhodocaloribacter litoris]|uniref:DoxX family protein n=1 Tax=Rhodocaloribacter litoris TaxID=2558931 RepID=UPI00141E8E4E|nr:DoxX family protein [Rhodocaloribacter litoris]QXD15956.1 DoxX family protein [Rhodocaloribacter litoris]
MKTILNLFEWRETHENYGLDFIRIFLGIALFVRGYLFMTNQTLLQDFIEESGLLLGGTIIHYITLAHLYGGFIMALGLMTRIAALVQIPVLIGAVYVHLTEGLLAQGQSLELSVLVLFLLLIIFVYGPGRLSLDYYFFKWQPAALPELDERAREEARTARTRLIEAARARAEQEHAVPHPMPDTGVAVLEQPRTRTATAPTRIDPEILEALEAAERLKMAIKYGGIFLFAFILLASMILMDAVPIFERGLAFEEFAVVAGTVLFIFGLFFFFYRSAFSDRRAGRGGNR